MSRPELGTAKRILIRGTNWVGDAVISIPAMREIRRIFPESYIALLVRPWVSDLYAAAEFQDEILVYDKNGIHRGWPGRLRLVGEVRLRRFDLAILLQNAFEAALIAWCARIPLRAGYARDARSLLLTHACPIDPDVLHLHQAYYYLDLLSGLGLLEKHLWKKKDYQLSLNLKTSDGDRMAAAEILRAYGVGQMETLVGINPGAYYGAAKRWLPDRYAKVADALAEEYGARILLFGSSVDRPIVEEVAKTMKHDPLVLAGRTRLGELMGLLTECSLLITNDSGPMHLAAALNVPQVAIFGSTSEIATGPISRHAVVVKNPVDCSPCFLRKCPTDFRCMTGISVAQVLEACRKQLDLRVIGRK